MRISAAGHNQCVSATPDPSALPAVQLPLEPDLRAPGQARQRTREVLLAWRLPTLIDSVMLVVSELVTNAVRYGRPPVFLVLRRRPDRVEIDVHDGDPGAPDRVLDPAGELDESGRGLAITQALAADVGWAHIPGDGKVVHASFDLDEAAPSR